CNPAACRRGAVDRITRCYRLRGPNMTKDPLLGPIYTDLGWVPAPRYLMRRARIKALLHDIPSGRLLEIGPGAGALLVEFMDAGYRCEALDSSSAARTRTQSMLSAAGHDVPVHAEP